MLSKDRLVLTISIILSVGSFLLSLLFRLKMKNVIEENKYDLYKKMSMAFFSIGVVGSFFIISVLYTNPHILEDHTEDSTTLEKISSSVSEDSVESTETSDLTSLDSRDLVQQDSVESSSLSPDTTGAERADADRANVDSFLQSSSDTMNTSKHFKGLDMGLFLHEKRLNKIERMINDVSTKKYVNNSIEVFNQENIPGSGAAASTAASTVASTVPGTVADSVGNISNLPIDLRTSIIEPAGKTIHTRTW